MGNKSREKSPIPELISNHRNLPRPFLVSNNGETPLSRNYTLFQVKQMRDMGYQVTPYLILNGIKSIDHIKNSTVACEICEDLPGGNQHPGVFPGEYRVAYNDGHFRMICNFHISETSNQKP